ncbi:MAG: serine hydrolase domain-containing protein [Bacteroidota bacterium]
MAGFFSFLNHFFSPKSKTLSLNDLSGLTKSKVIFQNLSTENKVPGISVTILKKGKEVLHEGYGYSNVEKQEAIVPKNTLFRIASISKCITGLAFGKMVEEGLVDWDGSFYDYVSYYPKKKYDFTLRQLASHTAGIRGYQGKEFAMNRPFSIKESISVFKDNKTKSKLL